MKIEMKADVKTHFKTGFKILSVILILMTALSCSHFPGRNPSNAPTKPRHFIVTVHGLSGNSKTFGYLGEAVDKFLPELNPNYDVHTVNFVYPTGIKESQGTFDFATGEKGLGKFIKGLFDGKPPLTPEDKISIVGHSQGGIIAYIWFFNSIIHPGEDFAYVKQVDSIITLGTPFWGSKISSILTDKRNIDVIPFIKLFAPDNFKMTRHEIADLAYSSDTVNTFRSLAIELDNDPSLEMKMKSLTVRLVNITGLLPHEKDEIFTSTNESTSSISDFTRKLIDKIYTLFRKSYSVSDKSKRRVESDLAVPVPSSRWNFLYTLPKKINDETTISASEYKDFSHFLDRSKVLFTEAVHLPFDTTNTFSMAYIGPSCLEVKTCLHPTFRYILEYLANCKDNPQCNAVATENIIQKMKIANLEEHLYFRDVVAKSLETFAIQINMKLNPGQIDLFPVKYFKKKNQPYEESIGYDSWEFNEYSLERTVIDLKNDPKTQISQSSNSAYTLVLGDKDESHSVDIVSRKATQADPFDRLRINVTGRVENLSQRPASSFVAPIEIKLPGLPKVKMSVLVQPGYSTYTELDYAN